MPCFCISVGPCSPEGMVVILAPSRKIQPEKYADDVILLAEKTKRTPLITVNW
ncbi:hypothetical protein COCON_G00107220 [Conger conger]|uniref:Uncharacterized protein n=1 Tax=Conger conger TaxID=82655 RepID=A0A9Q1DJ86_CONCO|nr:hypothetical protein COCON_G00107220 [Conger conger]